MGLTERHWFENEEPELTDRQLENIIHEKDKSYKSGYIKGYHDRSIRIVRCKDCKHRPVKPDNYENGFDLEFPDGKCPCQCDDGWYSWYPSDSWFYADGERNDS